MIIFKNNNEAEWVCNKENFNDGPINEIKNNLAQSFSDEDTYVLNNLTIIYFDNGKLNYITHNYSLNKISFSETLYDLMIPDRSLNETSES